MSRFKKILSLFMVITLMNTSAQIPITANAEGSGRYMENLDRDLIAMMTDNGIYMTWRLLGTEEYDTTFDIYRDGALIASSISNSTNYLDESGTKDSEYKVVSSNENFANVTKTAKAFETGKNYIEIPMAPVDDFVASEGDDNTNVFEYQIGDSSCGDVGRGMENMKL